MRSTANRRTGRNTEGKRRLRPAGAMAGAMAVVLTAVALAAGACSSTNEPKKTVASVGTGSTSASSQAATGKADPLAYAKCMRENGLPKFPDPKSGGGIAFKPGDGLDPAAPQFKAADSHCRPLVGAGGPSGNINGKDPWSSADKVKYAQCMRANGVSKFTDPDASGYFAPIIKGGPLDPESPQFKKAAAACKKYQPQNMPKTGPGGGS